MKVYTKKLKIKSYQINIAKLDVIIATTFILREDYKLEPLDVV